MLLVCLLGSNALAQNGFYATETIDFTGWINDPAQGQYNSPHATVDWSGTNIVNITSNWNGTEYLSEPFLSRNYTKRLTVQRTGDWNLWWSDNFNETYLQKGTDNQTSEIYISGVKAGDVVTIWGESGNNNGGCKITSGNTDAPADMKFNQSSPSYTFNITNDENSGTLALQFYNNYSGLRKITITSRVSHFDYDPGYEEYDMYDEFSANDIKKVYRNDENGQPYTSYTLSSEDTGITLNGNTAKYIILDDSKISANNRIAIDPNAGDWRFNYGLRAPDNGKWANFSICNLREGDRVVFSYTGTPPVFSSVAGGTSAPTEPYNGSKAFGDQYNDGIFDADEDVYITPGANPAIGWQRGEGAIYSEDHNGNQGDYQLYYTRAYVITEDGHLDIAIAPDTRIVKIKIYSDHQATMIDEYDAEKYIAKFDITGELQAKEHIVPGGLEVHVGSDDASQHAHVVRSTHGPVSIVNAVDGFKLPGMSRNEDGELEFEFDLANNIPETGTFYKFMPLEDGKMTLTFQAASMNYYSYSLNGDAVYYGDVSNYGDGNWQEQFDRPNEQTVGGQDGACPYYLVKVDINGNKTFTKINNRNYLNGAEVTYEIPEGVKAGETYYLYGAWNTSDLSYNGSGQGQNNLEYFPYGSGNGGAKKACGVAKLLEVQFNPNKKIYPLAKWVPNGTKAVKAGSGVPNPDTFETEEYLADLWGYNEKTSITVKKMSGNITACNPYLVPADTQGEHNHFKLVIDGIEFDDDNNKDQGGTILIKIGDATQKVSPVYALTIAYSTDPTYDGNSGTATRGHIWDYSSSSLHGLKYEPELLTPEQTGPNGHAAVYTHNAAVPEDYGHYFANYFDSSFDVNNYSSKDEVLSALPKSEEGLLYEEINSGNSDWMFNYNLVNAGKLHDPLFSNKYDLEGDNADLIWNTEGTVLKTSANASVMFNEFTGANVHQSEKDPDRYVGILQGGEFRIPWLRKNDRVIIYMGVGKGAFNDQAVFSIRGAYDAVHNVIDPADDYIVGGSHWDGENGDKNYRGCYHFFAQGGPTVDGKTLPADMVFKMTGGSMCKIYSIQIYRGDRIITNEIVDNADTENPFLLYSIKADPNETSSTNKDYTDNTTHEWALKYLGKEQQMANGTGKNSQKNEIIAQTGKYSSATPALTNNHKDAEDETSPVESFTYKHQLGEIGTFRMRGKDMEKNMNYVADYADHNVTIAYQETQKYPYTWDFTDVTGISDNVTNLFDPEEKLGETIESTTKPDGLTDAQWETLWNSLEATSYQKTSRDLSLWEVTSTNGDYMLRLNSQTSQSLDNMMEQDNIFETAKEIGGNQVWANGQIVPEMQGILLYTDNNNQNNGEWTIIQGNANNVGGLDFTGSSSLFKKIVVPNVPKDAAVYLRMKKLIEEPVIKYKFGEVTKNDDLAEIPTNSSIAKFYKVDGTNNDYIVALLNTNSSKTNLTFSLNGYRIHKMAVSTDPKKVNKLGWATESRDHVIDPELTSYLTGREFKTYIVTSADHASKTVTLAEVEAAKKVMPISENGDANAYIIRNMNLDTDPNNKEPGRVKILNDGFHLFVPDMHDYIADREDGLTDQKTLQGMTSSLMKSQLIEGTVAQKGGENVYNYVLTTETAIAGTNGENLSGSEQSLNYVGFFRAQKNGVSSSGNQGYLPLTVSTNAKYSFVFVKDWEVPTAIEVPSENLPSGIESVEGNASYYNMNGQRLNGRPSKSGIYIVNGKKVVLK